MRCKTYFLVFTTLVCSITSAGTGYTDDTVAMSLLHVQGCKSCHTLDDKGGTLGPVLNGVGNRMTHEQLKQKLLNPKKTTPTTLMPDYRHLTPTELELLTDYLARLR